MKLPKYIKELCNPAYVYLVLSVITVIILLVQNVGNTNTYCIGTHTCRTGNLAMIFIGKILWIAFWTYLLNLLCKSGLTGLSWFLVLIPFLMFFLVIAVMIYSIDDIYVDDLGDSSDHRHKKASHPPHPSHGTHLAQSSHMSHAAPSGYSGMPSTLVGADTGDFGIQSPGVIDSQGTHYYNRMGMGDTMNINNF